MSVRLALRLQLRLGLPFALTLFVPIAFSSCVTVTLQEVVK